MTTQSVAGRVYEFGLRDRLRIAREEAGYNQQRFADASGISRSSVQNYESGATTPKRPQLIAWAMATGFSMRWLETGEAGPDGDGGGGVVVRREGIEPPTRCFDSFPGHGSHRFALAAVA